VDGACTLSLMEETKAGGVNATIVPSRRCAGRHIEPLKVWRMITTDAASAAINLVSTGLSMVHRKVRADLFLKKRLKRYEKW
jgi:hypothetical protein